MPKCNQKCKKCNDLFYVCPNCDKEVYSREGYCSYECWSELPLVRRLEMTGQYEAADEIKRLELLLAETSFEVSEK